MSWMPDDLQAALLTAVVREWDNTSPRPPLGRTKLQKLAYFLASQGVPLNLDYEMYHYGPYSQDLADALDWLEAFQIIEDQKPAKDNDRVADYRLGPGAGQLLTQYAAGVARHEAVIKQVVRRLVKKRPSESRVACHGTLGLSKRRNKYRREPGDPRGPADQRPQV